jgi:hypothetical protein
MHRYPDVRILFKLTSISNDARKDEDMALCVRAKWGNRA